MNYVFFDTDLLTGNEDYDIVGADYAELIQTCFRYSEYFSVWFSPHVQWAEKLKPYEITVDPACFEYAPPRDSKPSHIADIVIYLHFYRICPELYTILTDNIHSIWEWIDGWDFKNPENPHFYRADGTCFFMCNTHDGECFFYAREDEDVSVVVNKEHWYREQDLWPNAITSPQPKGYRKMKTDK